MKRAYNFNAGPSAMPLEVLLEAQEEFLNYKNTGMSIIEMSHRSNEYAAMHAETKQLLRELMEIPEDYEIMFIQGGGSTQFLMTAANFHTKTYAAYVNTGVWAKKAMAEGKFYGEVYEAASSADKNHSYIPQEFTLRPDTSYIPHCQQHDLRHRVQGFPPVRRSRYLRYVQRHPFAQGERQGF